MVVYENNVGEKDSGIKLFANQESGKDDFEFFCRTMGLDKNQINVILNSEYSNKNKVLDYIDAQKVLGDNPMAKMPSPNKLMSENHERAAKEILGYRPDTEEEANIVVEKFIQNINAQNVTTEQYVALKKYTASYYKAINTYMRLGGKEEYRKYMTERLMGDIQKQMKRKYENDFELTDAQKGIITKCTNETLASCERESVYDKQKDYSGVLEKYKDVIANDRIYRIMDSFFEEYSNEYSFAVIAGDYTKSAIAFSDKIIEKPTILHRIVSVEGLKNSLGIGIDADFNIESLKGRVFQDDGHTSTALNRTNIYNRVRASSKPSLDLEGSDVYLEILAPAGTKGINISKMSDYENEGEVLLNPNSMYIYDVDKNFSDRAIKITCVAISKDISSYPSMMQEQNKQMGEDIPSIAENIENVPPVNVEEFTSDFEVPSMVKDDGAVQVK